HQAILFEEATGERELTPDMTVAQGMLYEALEEIADEVGQFSQADAHYMPESPFADQGMVCSNCAFYQGPAACEVVEGEIAPGALCKHWIIPASKLSVEPAPTGRQLLSDELQRCFGSGVMRRELDVAMAPEPTEDGIRFTFSSESPVARWYGEEVLSHAPGAADLSRLNNRAVHLWNHDRDVVLGVVTGAEIGADRRGVVTTRWSPNTNERGSEEWKRRRDVESGITSKVSFAYEIREAMDMGDGKILVTRWAPLEVSTVSIPADDSVGHERQQWEHPAEIEKAEREELDYLQDIGAALTSSERQQREHPAVATPPPAVEPEQSQPSSMEEHVSAPPETMTVETQQDARSAAEVERERIKSINAICRQHGMPEGMAEDLVDAGASVDQAREQVLGKIGARSRELQPGGLHVEADALIGMDQRDLSRYSMMKLLRHLADPTNQALRDAAGFELDCHRAAELKADRAANGAWIPFDWVVAKRDQTVGNFGKGGALVGTELLAGSFIDLLINQSALLQSGITTLSGLTGNVDIPRKTAASQHYWVGEDVDVTPSDVTFGLISSTPKTVGVRVPVSRRSLIQTTPDIDTLVRQDMAERMALGVDSSGLYGTGSNAQPLGLRNVTGIGSVTLGGGASQVYPSNLGSGTHDSGDWADYIDLRAACTAANVNVGSARYIMNAITEAGGMKTLRASAAGSDYIVSDAGTIGRHPVLVSNQVQTNDVFYGVFSDLILATWSGLDIVVDPYTQSAKGQVIYTVMQDLDWVCRRAASFALGT
ncbi:MAG: phage major capsid protein, partial [Caulobacteraceae bacterium]|nr:phage major capsid protein [Caulobacteraceae bacterium]